MKKCNIMEKAMKRIKKSEEKETESEKRKGKGKGKREWSMRTQNVK
jgi:hypothetical protein